MKKYLRVWLKNTALSLQSELITRGSTLFFVAGKIFRFYFFLALIFVIVGKEGQLKNYSSEQVFIFFLVFNFFDILGQLFFRGIYWFRNEVISGYFDLVLIRPISPLFSVMTGKTDFLDLPLLFIVLYLLIKEGVNYTLGNIALFLVIGFCGFLLITSIHILVACFGILTTDVVWIFRDLSSMAKIPVDIYHSWIRAFLIFIIPIGIIFTFPAKALMGILSWQWVIYSFCISITIFLISLKLWRFSLTKYSSASS